MPRMLQLQRLAIFLCLLLVGCYHEATTAERRASFAPYIDAKIDDVYLGEYIRDRSMPLMKIDNKDKLISTAWAAAIDHRGYYLTVAHAVRDGKTVQLGYSNRNLKAEVVWCGDVSKKQPDLAILHVDVTLDKVFEWSTDYNTGDTVLGDGYSAVSSPSDNGLPGDKDEHLRGTITDPKGRKTYLVDGCFVGKIRAISVNNEWTASMTHIANDAPAHRGDSGGALVKTDGRLVGITYVAIYGTGLFWTVDWQGSEAVRPDLAWLQKTIDDDFASRAAQKTQTPSPAAQR